MPPDLRMSWVVRKLNHARYQFAKLEEVASSRDLFATLDAFLSEARSVLYVLGFQFGWEERRKPDRMAVAAERSVRQRFDRWFKRNAKAVLDHPLTLERHEVVHRSGSPSFGHPITKPRNFYFRDANGRKINGLDYCREYLRLIETVVCAAESRVSRVAGEPRQLP